MRSDFFRSGVANPARSVVAADDANLTEACQLQRILVPIDFSTSSRRALQLAVELASESDAELILFHVFEKVPPELKIFEAVFAEPSFREQALQDLEAWLGLIGGKSHTRAVFREARSASREILNAAAELDVQLIVLGRHSRSRFNRLWLGSTADQVSKAAHCAVLLAAPETFSWVA